MCVVSIDSCRRRLRLTGTASSLIVLLLLPPGVMVPKLLVVQVPIFMSDNHPDLPKSRKQTAPSSTVGS